MSSIDDYLKSVQTQQKAAPSAAVVQPGPTGNESFPTVVMNAAGNFLPSLGKAFTSLSPKNLAATGKQLALAALGAVLPSHAGGDLVTPQSPSGKPLGPAAPTVPVTQSKPVQAFTQLGQNFEGGAAAGAGKQGFTKKLETDPVGLLLDNVMALDGVGGGLSKIGDATGLDALKTAGDAVSKTAETVNPVSAPFKAAGEIVSKIGSPSGALDTGVVSDAEDLGLNKDKLPVQATSTNPIVQKAAGFLQGGFFGKKLVQTAADLRSQLTDIASKTADELPKAEEKGVLGQRVSDALDQAESVTNKSLETAYNEFTSKYGDTPATSKNTVAAIKGILSDYETSATPAPKSATAFLQKTLDNLQSGRGSAMDAAREQNFPPELIAKALGKEGEAPSATTFKTLKATRTVIGQMLDTHPELKPIYRALSEDRSASLDNIDTTASAKIKALDGDYKQFINDFGDAVSRKIHSSTPEQVVNQFIKGDNATSLAKLKDRIDPATFQAIGTSWIAKAVDDATDENGRLDPSKFLKNVDKLDNATKKVLLSPAQQQMISQASDTLGKVQHITDAVSKNNNVGSFAQTRMILQGLGIPFALTTGNAAVIKSLAALLSGEYLGSKFLSSDLGKRILTTGIPAVEKAGSTVKEAGSAAGAGAQASNLGARK